MGYLDGIEPRLRQALELRKLSLHERADRSGHFDVYWDDGIKNTPDDRGLPVGFLNVSAHPTSFTQRKVEVWWVSVSSPVVHEVASRLPNINEAISELLVYLPDRYS
ncbi:MULTISPECIES: hypothetical protein [unclassified Streptomyces]|uniref:hypothetical protein n=1 Tax=unclassified Streptomyces TaxID=2593676 RepID=UPI00336AA33D